ncbi:MAG: glycosyl hydrolase family 28 protein [Bacteroidales bacterium]|nr:glycosyl hydrolase family 28 protein [Bacteroidales bacterium]
MKSSISKSLILLFLILSNTGWARENGSNESLPKTKFPKEKFNILDYGAIANSPEFSTFAINNAIENCSMAGGGYVIIPKGKFSTTSIILKSNVNLRLDEGAVLQFSTRAEDYFGTKAKNGIIPLIYAESESNIAISGKGIIDAQNNWVKQISLSDSTEIQTMSMTILLVNCHQVKIEDVQILNAPTLSILLQSCDNVVFDDIAIENPKLEANALIIEHSTHIVLNDKKIEESDKALAIKRIGLKEFTTR